MNNKEIFSCIADINLDSCLNLPNDELEKYDNENNLSFIKRQRFKCHAKLNKEKNINLLARASAAVIEKIQGLSALSSEALKEILVQKRPQMQFRNFNKLEDSDLREILTDILLLEDLENE
ncbi:MAG: hypothetical protein GQ574_04115 [Crocinitomix sp.]|nr:hypothetical protein [Crocinitomix sp.]